MAIRTCCRCDDQAVTHWASELRGHGCVLRPWAMDDLPTVLEAGRDPLIPLMTTVLFLRAKQPVRLDK